jgi:hypothetical protein
MTERDELINAFPDAFTDPPSPSASFAYLIDRLRLHEELLKTKAQRAFEDVDDKNERIETAVELLALADKLPVDYHRGSIALIREYLK